jgi:glycosyltransferase involved in cell wall biosynthesis
VASDDVNVIQVGYKLLRYINIFFNLFGLQYKFLPTKLMDTAKWFKPDIISLNQVEGGYFQTRDIIKLSKIAPVFWTMHDEWAFNNSAHRTPDLRTTYPQVGIRWGSWLKRRKQKIYNKANFSFICPSNWLRTKSNIDKDGYIIPNGVDINKFSPGETKNLLFVSEKISKGDFGFLKHLDELLDYKIQLILIGEGELKGDYKNIIITNKGYIEDEETLIYYYRLADVFVHPTSADNCPMTLLEASACGTPTIGYDVGGVKEIANCAVRNEATFAAMIMSYLRQPPLAKKPSDINETAKKYYEIFNGRV